MSGDRKTLYVHIGRPKVGSTALQRFLHSNRDRLRLDGVLYPKTGERQKASHGLSDALVNPDESSERTAVATSVYGQLREEMAMSNAEKVILSSENFYFIDPTKLAQHLPEDLSVNILVYLRRQDEVLISSYLQEWRDDSLSATERDDLDAYLANPARLELLDYAAVLDRWAAAFGEKNVWVRVYREGQSPQDLFNDLLVTLGVSSLADYVFPSHRVNPSPPRDVLSLIGQVNGMSTSPLMKRQLRSLLVNVGVELPYDPQYDAKAMFTAEQRARALAYFEASNRETARRYLGRSDGTLFDGDVKSVTTHGDRSELGTGVLDVQRVVTLLLTALAQQQEEMNRLIVQLQAAQDSATNRGES
ncbi:MAG: hypothetical protein AAGA91_08590 [Pseudomonadota bacterium]